jgi:hypothetical protein
MDSCELLKKINEQCFEAIKHMMTDDTIQTGREGCWSGNFDDVYDIGVQQGRAEFAEQIVELLKEFSRGEI